MSDTPLPGHLSGLTALHPQGKIVFALCCCERVAPNFRAFYLQSGRGAHIEELDRLIEDLWKASEHCDSPEILAPVGRKCLATAASLPVQEPSESPFLGMAQDALGAVQYATRYIFDRNVADPEHLIRQVAVWAMENVREWIGLSSAYDPLSLYPDTRFARRHGFPVDQIKHETAPEDDETWMANHAMALAEQSKQRFDIAVLARAQPAPPEIVRYLRQSSQNLGIQPFLRGFLNDPGDRGRARSEPE